VKFASEYRDAENKAAADIVTKDWTSAGPTIARFRNHIDVDAEDGCTCPRMYSGIPDRHYISAKATFSRGIYRGSSWVRTCMLLVFGVDGVIVWA